MTTYPYEKTLEIHADDVGLTLFGSSFDAFDVELRVTYGLDGYKPFLESVDEIVLFPVSRPGDLQPAVVIEARLLPRRQYDSLFDIASDLLLQQDAEDPLANSHYNEDDWRIAR